MLTKAEMDNLKKLAKGIAAQFGSDCEVVIHELGEQSAAHSIVAIENGHVSGRKIGDGPSQVVLEQLANGDTREDHLSYLTKTPDGKILKSSTIYMRDENGEVGAIFGINFDISRLSIVSDAVGELISAANRSEEPPRIAQNVADLGAEFLHVVAVALLAELAEAAEILADLGGGDAHLHPQGVGGDADNALAAKVVQMAVIPGKTPDDGVGDVLLFHIE